MTSGRRGTRRFFVHVTSRAWRSLAWMAVWGYPCLPPDVAQWLCQEELAAEERRQADALDRPESRQMPERG
ncbi:hypothetical protein [Sinosporangium siamense]|uniref:Uncharacterized protein n=1 Tax=Sinosporangium siamense TaxID=1367973 RepID=A0A919RMD0_9ACTN|nr:hypothetical protein [Sinosporangium siamense]GII95069.1 hypothetical protein Ssi02_53000 [Sinosporangium siamense]